MLRHLLLGLAWALRCVPLLACNVGFNGLAPPDSSLQGDAGSDSSAGDDDAASSDDGSEAAPPCDPTTCNGACCGSTCVTDNCASCFAGGIFCPSSAGAGGTCGTGCASCAISDGPTVACYSCEDSGLTAQCAGAASDCPGDLGAGACPCPGGTAEECPGPLQVCVLVEGTYVCLSR
jgi:hypothetical protein